MPYADPAKRKEYHRAYHREWYRRNKKRILEKSKEYNRRPERKLYNKLWRQKNREKINKRNRMRYSTEKRWEEHIREKFGMSPEQYSERLKAQGNGCAICGVKPYHQTSPHGVKGRFDIDHDHNTQKIRGLLCKRCNRGLGAFRDTADLLKKALAYLEKNA